MDRMNMMMLSWATIVVSPAAMPLESQQMKRPLQVALAQTQGEESAGLRTRVSLELADVALDQAIKTIARHAGLRVTFGEDVYATKKRVTLSVQNMPVDDVFALVLRGTNIRMTTSSAGHLFFGTPGTKATTVNNGGVTGRVVDAQTKKPLVGATVTILQRKVITDDNGVFHLQDLAPGTHTLLVRHISHSQQTVRATVTSGLTTKLEIALTPSPTGLDRVVVTGTVAASEIKKVPNAISVVTAQDIQNRGITQIAQLFRGEIPGVIALNNQDSPDGALVMLSRGRTSLTQADQTNTPAIKTYIDGIELADPRYLSQIDVNSIDRIEIIAGPQASTIYGSAALGGVMQIFTKRGSASRPRVSGTFQSGTVENSFRSNFAPRHDYSLQLDGGDQRTTYQFGIGYKYDGQWTPGRFARTTLGNLGIQRTEGRLEVGVSALMSQRTAGNGSMNPLGAFGLNGLFRLNPEAAMVRQLETSNDQQTIGLTLTHQTRSWLTQALTIGRSNVSVETQRLAPSFSMPGDSTFDRSITPQVRQSVTYNMAVRRQLGDAIDATATVGGDYWNYKTHTVFAEQGPGDGSFGLTQLRAEDDENHGGFAQVQLGMFDRAFFTVGLRAENNTSFGENIGYKFTPRYGVSVTQEMANVSTRLRASYGRSTRPPQHEQTMPYYHTVPEYGTYQARLAAPNLLPEEQRGWEAGIDLYLGQKISVALTRYDQTVRNTIHNLHGIDSVRSLVPGPSGEYTYALQGQFVNIASIRNRGWELQGMVYVGPLSFRGAYTAAMSRIGHIPNLPEAFVQLGIIPGASMSSTPEHSGSLTVGYTTAKTTANVTVMRIGRNSSGSDSASIYREQLRLQAMRNRWRTPDNYRAIQEGYSMVDVALQREIVTGITAICNVSNLLDLYRNDLVFWSPTQGRQIMAGLRFNRR